jgi:hypothetical protein
MTAAIFSAEQAMWVGISVAGVPNLKDEAYDEDEVVENVCSVRWR